VGLDWTCFQDRLTRASRQDRGLRSSRLGAARGICWPLVASQNHAVVWTPREGPVQSLRTDHSSARVDLARTCFLDRILFWAIMLKSGRDGPDCVAQSRQDQPMENRDESYLCSRPDCRKITVEPHASDANKRVLLGNACHIRAAAPGGPRYDPDQSEDERRSISNAIWLCLEHAKVIDADPSSYPANLLLEWKGAHEQWIRDKGVVPDLPVITLSTMGGITLPATPGAEISDTATGELKEHEFRIENHSQAILLHVRGRIQLPEPIVGTVEEVPPLGVSYVWREDRPNVQANATGRGYVRRSGPQLPTHLHIFGVERLPPAQPFSLRFQTSLKEWQEHDHTAM